MKTTRNLIEELITIFHQGYTPINRQEKIKVKIDAHIKEVEAEQRKKCANVILYSHMGLSYDKKRVIAHAMINATGEK